MSNFHLNQNKYYLSYEKVNKKFAKFTVYPIGYFGILIINAASWLIVSLTYKSSTSIIENFALNTMSPHSIVCVSIV